jgi:hypothetical protein
MAGGDLVGRFSWILVGVRDLAGGDLVGRFSWILVGVRDLAGGGDAEGLVEDGVEGVADHPAPEPVLSNLYYYYYYYYYYFCGGKGSRG